MMQTDKSATLSTHNTQTLFDPIPIADKATRYKGGGDTRSNAGRYRSLARGVPNADGSHGREQKGKDRQPDLQMAERPGERLSQI